MRIFQTQQTPKLLLILVILTVVALGDIKLASVKEVDTICKQAASDLAARTVIPMSQGIGKALYSYDFTTGRVLYAKNADIPLPLASLTKLMTVRVALEKTPDPNALYTLTAPDLAPDWSLGMSVGERYSTTSLVYAALIPSSNDAAEALMHSTHLSDQMFFQAMDDEGKKLGLNSLSYASATGLDNDDGSASSYGSAQDITALLHADDTDYPDIFSMTTKPTASIVSDTGVVIPLVSTNLALNELQLLVAGKTGYTLTAGGNLAILWKASNGDMIGATVLGSTEDGRFSDMILLYNVSNSLLEDQSILPAACK